MVQPLGIADLYKALEATLETWPHPLPLAAKGKSLAFPVGLYGEGSHELPLVVASTMYEEHDFRDGSWP